MDGTFAYNHYIPDCEEGTVFKYVAIVQNRKTGREKARFIKEARFMDYKSYLCCLERWNKYGAESDSEIQWVYEKPKL